MSESWMIVIAALPGILITTYSMYVRDGTHTATIHMIYYIWGEMAVYIKAKGWIPKYVGCRLRLLDTFYFHAIEDTYPSLLSQLSIVC